MSKSKKRVEEAARQLGLDISIIHTPDGTHTAAMAANFCGCELGQIAKSIIFSTKDGLIMFITAGDKRVNIKAASLLAGALEKADAAMIRETTGFAIGGVSPLGSLHPIRQYFDKTLLRYEEIFAAAGTPQHLFSIAPRKLQNALEAEIAEFVE